MEQTAFVSLGTVRGINATPLPLVENHPEHHNTRIDGVFWRTLQSPLFWMSSAATALAAFCRTAPIPSSIRQTLFAPVLGLGLVAFGFAVCRQRKHLWYEISLASTMLLVGLGCHTWYDKIHPHVILGAIPLHNQAHESEFSKRGIRAVLSLVEDHEAESSSIFSEPVVETEWQAHHIDFLRLPTADLTPPSIDKLKHAVAFIDRQAKANKITYVHCKAGRGRSATVVICYLLKHGSAGIVQYSAEPDMVKKAIAFVRHKRPQIYLTASQKLAIRTYYAQECQQV